MMRLSIFTIFGFIYLGSACREDKPPVFSSEYSVRGVLTIPYAELTEPFFAWYDSHNGRSRIDYYGGTVKTYQISGMGPYGSLLKIAPVTTEDTWNVDTCLQVNGTSDSKVKPQTILPDLNKFKCVGTEMLNGVECEVWKYVESIGDKTSKYTMWISWKTSSKLRGTSRPEPVRYEMKGYNNLLGSHFDHYYLDYDLYSTERIAADTFKVSTNMTCTHFPGPGHYHTATFNPLREFVHHDDAHVDRAWEDFISTHNKRYNAAELEHHRRKEVFRQNLRFIHSKNRAKLGFTLSVNHLADRSEDELKALRGRRYSVDNNGASPFPYSAVEVQSISADLPDQFDWRLYGAVTPVKDQSVCGSCWSFGTTGAVEGAYFVKTGHLLRLSQQALIDCSWGYGNNGCDGGEDFRSYQWIMKHGGLPLESDYGGYLGQDGYCHIDKVQLTAKITGYVNVTSNDENALRLAIFKHGPISVAIDADHRSFSFYSNGVYYDPECKNKVDELDHAVLAVGYGKLNGKDYWLVKNSWSNLWGNDGYVLMSAKDNNCGVMTTPTYVTF
ncbi:C1 family peptidase 26-29-p [Rhodnius prolixus]